MAIISSRKEIHLKDIDRLNQRKTQILDKVSEVHLLPKAWFSYAAELTCNIAAGTAWDTVPIYENICQRQQ